MSARKIFDFDYWKAPYRLLFFEDDYGHNMRRAARQLALGELFYRTISGNAPGEKENI